jgi:hypothetical protein
MKDLIGQKYKILISEPDFARYLDILPDPARSCQILPDPARSTHIWLFGLHNNFKLATRFLQILPFCKILRDIAISPVFAYLAESGRIWQILT